MPIYEYRCRDCGREFELLILKASQPVTCRSCGTESVERLLSTFSASSESSRQASTAAAYKYNNKLNARQEPDKPRIHIEHKHQH